MTSRSAPKWLKFLVDFGPLVIFFASFKLYDMRVATGALMVSTVIGLVLGYIVVRHISPMQKVTAVAVLLFGGLTFLLNDNSYVKLKPTAVQAFFSAVLFAGFLLKKPTLQYVLGEALQMREEGWRQLTLRYALFFAAMAILNEIVWRNFSEDFWINFKVFGILGLTMVFSIAQMPLMKRYMIEAPESEKS